MPKVLDVTVRIIEYRKGDVILPYTEYRKQHDVARLPASLQIEKDDLALCRYVAENCLPLEPLFSQG